MTQVDAEFWRAPPPIPYVWGGQCLAVSAATLALTAAALRSVGRREAGCLWLGPTDDEGNTRAAAVIMPKQLNRAGNYAVSAGALLEVANVGRPRGWTVVGAIHSHPGTFVEHSRFDDEMTPSRRAVSIVFPCYGDWRGPWPSNLGVHSYSGDYWHRLTDSEAAKRVKVDDEAQALWVDLR